LENKKRLIDANEPINAFKRYAKNHPYATWNAFGIEEVLNSAKTVDAVEVVHGRWLLERTPDGKPYCFHCSVCDDDFGYIGISTAYRYCPNCGAKMDK
jgi:rubrerythrin